jgi:hypothetical protein
MCIFLNYFNVNQIYTQSIKPRLITAMVELFCVAHVMLHSCTVDTVLTVCSIADSSR